jgi:hypothetical protein
MNISEQGKDKNLSTFDYLQVLQLEYTVCMLRKRIYPREVDRNYWGGVCESKKKNILDISERNRLPTIFEDQDIDKSFKNMVYLDKYFPLFTYRDEVQRLKQEKWDKAHYYRRGESFRVFLNGEQTVLALKFCSKDFKKLTFCQNDKDYCLDAENCIRIL